MKEIKLTQGGIALVDDADFEMLDQWKWYESDGYAHRMEIMGEKRKVILMHRYIMKTPSRSDTDHINGNRLDNQRSNLRIVNRSQNMANTTKKANNTSGYKGVCFTPKRVNHKKRWTAAITKDYKSYYLGHFFTKEEAAIAYNNKAKAIFGDFAKLNIILT